jgi:hypothetical protein
MAAGLAPTNPLESGIAATLPPGLYTALLAGVNNSIGVGLVEVYDRGAPQRARGIAPGLPRLILTMSGDHPTFVESSAALNRD